MSSLSWRRLARLLPIAVLAAAAAAHALELPVRGQTQAMVAQQFGEPLTRHAAVGQPPITRWDYAEFSVYFEHQHTLHAVPHDQPLGELAIQSGHTVRAAVQAAAEPVTDAAEDATIDAAAEATPPSPNSDPALRFDGAKGRIVLDR